MSSKYYCSKCKHNHFYSSEIGKKHLEFKKNNNETKIITENKPVQNNGKDDQKQENTIKFLNEVEFDNNTIYNESTDKNIKSEEPSNRVAKFIRDYQKSYKKGIELYGIWWKIFQLSIWSIILVFLLTAIIIFIVFLPKIDFINWMLR